MLPSENSTGDVIEVCLPGASFISRLNALSPEGLAPLHLAASAGADRAVRAGDPGRCIGSDRFYMAVVVKTNFGTGASRISVYSGDWDVHWGYGVLTHGYV